MVFFTNLLAQVISKNNLLTIEVDEHSMLDFLKEDCYIALENIKKCLEDESLSDFDVVEKIVQIFEELGSDGGFRHDF